MFKHFPENIQNKKEIIDAIAYMFTEENADKVEGITIKRLVALADSEDKNIQNLWRYVGTNIESALTHALCNLAITSKEEETDNVTAKALEETAAEIIKLLSLRKINRFKQSNRFKR